MRHRLIALGLCAASLVGIGVGYLLLRHPDVLPWCARYDCLSQHLLLGFAKPLYRSTWPLPLLFFAIAFTDKKTFSAWLTYFGFLVIGPVLLIIAAEPVQTGFFLGPFPDRVGMTLIMSMFVAVASGAFVFARYLWVRGQGTEKEA